MRDYLQTAKEFVYEEDAEVETQFGDDEETENLEEEQPEKKEQETVEESSEKKVLLVNIMTITIVISQPMKWMISIWKIPIASLIVPGNLNIRGNRNCKKNILFNPGKNRTTQNYNV